MRRPHGFTLIELLVAMVIIAILATMVMFAIFRAQQSAREARTQAMIAKLHTIVARRWDEYQTRRIPVDTVGLNYPNYPNPVVKIAELRLVAMRQLMRLELPDRWSEVASVDSDGNGGLDTSDQLPELTQLDGTSFNPIKRMPIPALAKVYYRYYTTISEGKTSSDLPSDQFQNAECLFMILSQGLSHEDDGLKLFSEQEVGDVDDDGAKEFLDGWGTPIRFLRWPVGFVNDAIQDATDYPFGHLSDLQPIRMPQDATDIYRDCVPNAVDEHDPFDPRFVDKQADAQGGSVAFRVFPLIYSAGPDKIFDIYSGPANDPNDPSDDYVDDPYAAHRVDSDPCAVYDPTTDSPKFVGAPADLDSFLKGTANGGLDHQDNIHNHLIDARLE